MKYASLLEADCRKLDTVKADIVALERQLQFHATPNFMPDFIVFRRSSITNPVLTPTRLGSRYTNNRTWYMDTALLVVMAPSC